MYDFDKGIEAAFPFGRKNLIEFNIAIHQLLLFFVTMKRTLSNLILSLFVFAFFTLFSCESDENKSGRLEDIPVFKSEMDIEYARNFRVEYFEDYKKVTVLESFRGASKPEEYYLVDKEIDLPTLPADAKIIRTPISEIVVSSTSHLPMLELIGEAESLVGFPTLDLISSRVFRDRIDAGAIRDVGRESGFNKESLIDLQPELVVGFTLGTNLDAYSDINRVGIPVVFNAEYLEETPLGRAEWIKFMAVFYNKEAQADAVFTEIKNRYNDLLEKAKAIENKPTALSGMMYGDTWYAPGGQSWASKFFVDAGVDYFWQNTETTGSLELSFESVLDIAEKAEFWVGVANVSTLTELKNSNARYALFAPFQQGNVWTYNKRMGAKGGNDYLEMGYARPDLILSDLVKIFHPQLLPDYETYFFQQLSE